MDRFLMGGGSSPFIVLDMCHVGTKEVMPMDESIYRVLSLMIAFGALVALIMSNRKK
jgi:hypothetical protein